jgi:hypothetical protein
LSETLAIQPYIDFPNGHADLGAKNVESRLVFSERALCIDALAAQPDASVRATPPSRNPNVQGVPLVLSDRNELGRRWGFRCAE